MNKTVGIGTILIILLALTAILAMPSPLRGHASSGPLAAFTYEPCFSCAVLGFLIFFNANSSISTSGSITSYAWDFGDGTPNTTGTTPTATHDYSIASSALVTLTVTDALGQSNSISQNIIYDAVPRFDYQPSTDSALQTVVFNATQSKVYNNSNTNATYTWSFGDGGTGTGIIARHAYLAPGIYRAELTFNTVYGKSQVSRTVRIGPGAPPPLVQTVFDGYNVSASGGFLANTNSMTITGTANVQVSNATTGALILTKSYNVSFTYRSSGMIKLVLAVPTSPLMLGITCTVDTINGGVQCALTRDPDLFNHGTVDIIDLSAVYVNYGQSSGSPKFSPAADLDANGTVNIIDASIETLDYGAPVFQ